MKPHVICIAVICLLFFSMQAYTKELFPDEDVKIKRVSPAMKLADFEWVRKKPWDELYGIPQHPAFDSLRTRQVEDSLLTLINARKAMVGDTLSTRTFFYCWKPYFEWLRGIDPHYMVCPYAVFDVDYSHEGYRKEILSLSKAFQKTAKIIPVNTLNVRDTIFVESSLDERLRYGDIILSVNGVSADTLLENNYAVRHAPLYMLMLYYSFGTIQDDYVLEILRGGERKIFTIKGIAYSDALYRLSLQAATEHNIGTYDSTIGYISIPTFFPNNSRLIKILRNNLKKFKKGGIENVILDLRKNPGGNGHAFDRLLSIFIDKPEIEYCTSHRLKVSRSTMNDHDFLEESMLGKMVDLPEEKFNRTIPLNNKLYIEGIRYFVLMDEGTESMAATFCNILQYNDAAILVGEPLLKNATIYGETLERGRHFFSVSSKKKSKWDFHAALVEAGISTTETLENTKAVDGILFPDIEIPYRCHVIAEGKDNLLEELVLIIKSKKQ